MKLFKFKSNQNTVVKSIEDNYVQTVWTKEFESGYRSNFIYYAQPENLSPLTKEETADIVAKLEKMGLPTKI